MNNLRVYLDNCCYNRPYDDQTQLKISLETQAKLHIQKMIIDNKLELVYSYISVYENSRNPDIIRKLSISDFFKNAVIYVDETHSSEIVDKATEIMKTGVKQMDALHVAAAIVGHSDYFFTTDMRLLKYSSSQISIINPIDFIVIPEV